MINTEIRDWIIYKITNPNGSYYIGKTCNYKSRIGLYKSMGKAVKTQPMIYNSLVKYGFDNHKIEILDKLKTNNAGAGDKEMFWIRTFMSNVTKWRDGKGMNLSDGGEGTLGAKFINRVSSMKGRKHSVEARRKLSEYNKANPARGMLGKKHTEKAKLGMSINKKGKPNLHLKGVPLKQEVKDKISAALKGRPSSIKGQSIWSAEDRRRIGESKRGNTYMKGKTLSNEVKEKQSEIHSRLFGKPIIQYSKNGEYLNEFISIRVAAKETNIKRGQIRSSLNNPNTKFNDFIFKYK